MKKTLLVILAILFSASFANAQTWHTANQVTFAWAVNPATAYPTVAAAVTLADETGQLILGTGSDTLALSTASAGITYMVSTRNSAQRSVSSMLTVAIADTGTAANTVSIYLVFEKP